MREIKLTSDELVSALLRISKTEVVCILDSCGVRHLGSHLLIAGVRPVESIELSSETAASTLDVFDNKSRSGLAGIFTLSYDFGLKLQCIDEPRRGGDADEPDLFLSLFDVLVIHDYEIATTFLLGNEKQFDEIESLLRHNLPEPKPVKSPEVPSLAASSNFTRRDYVVAVEKIQEYIRTGDTYQANLTQQLTCTLQNNITPQDVFLRLRENHPAPFGAFVTRSGSTVVSASPERFFRIRRNGNIEASPIKGTRARGKTADEDDWLRRDLKISDKDRAENIMIVDLLRNDLGRVCEFGSVYVERLCEVEEHPTLFHLVSTINGQILPAANLSDIIRATFPCGSITGAPKLRTMKIIEEIESKPRGLSMGAIGCFLPESWPWLDDTRVDVSVAIRTMVIRDRNVTFNVGGGIVIDSEPEKEYEESLLKARALLNAIGAVIDQD